MIPFLKDAVALCFYAVKSVLPRPAGEVVLLYHAVEEGTAEKDPLKMCVSPALFAQQMSELARQKIPAVITFDDGYESVHRNAFPILRQFRFPVILFLTTGFIDRQSSMDGAFAEGYSPAPLTWEQVREMASAGVEIGSHAVTHRKMSRLDTASMEREAVNSRRRIEEKTGRPVRAFAYPIGNAGSFSPPTEEVLRRAGYTCAYINRMGNSRGRPFQIPRMRVYRTDSLFRFRLKVAGAYNWVDAFSAFCQ